MNPSNYIPTLDGWRAVAIAGVILSHSFASTYWTRHGALGVNLFFAISGFLITSRLLDESAKSGDISLRNFYIRRAFRILPPALTYLAVVGALTLGGVIYSSGKDIASAALFVRNYCGADAHGGWYTGHFWSLAVEEQFYLFWPALLVLVRTRRARWLAPALAVAFSVWRSLDLRHGWIATFFHDEMLRNDGLRSDYRMDSLLWGCTLALFRVPRIALKRWTTPVGLALVATIVALNVRQPQSYMVGEALLFPALLAVTIANPNSRIGRVLEAGSLRWIGRLSYSLYLWQQLFVSQYHHGALQHWPVNVALAVGCAVLSYRFVEQPAMRMGHRLVEGLRYHMDRTHDVGRTRPRVSAVA